MHDVASPQVRPRVVAHRGSSRDYPEHTLEAYQRAFDVGADGIECDVRLTRDGQLVCVHDRRVDRVSNGIGKVSLFTLAQLREMQWGNGAFQVLTLRQLLALVADQDPNRGIEIAIETKHPNRYAGAVEREVVDQLDWFGWVPHGPDGATPARVMSFSEVALQRLLRWAPTVPRVYLVKARGGQRGGKKARARDRPAAAGGAGGMLRTAVGQVPAEACTVGLDVRLVRAQPELVSRYQSRGYAVHAWTVDEPDDVRACVDAGITAIITNRPDHVLAWLDGRQAR